MFSPPKIKKIRTKVRRKDEIVLEDLANEITLDVKPKRTNGHYNPNSSSKQQSESQDFNYIQDDLWFKIADHIDPEDVGRFALICKQTSNVVSSATFWKNLYRRFCKNSDKLPIKLESRCKNQIGSIRSNVICALYHLYPPFIERIKKSYELTTLNGLSLFYHWYWQAGPYWFFCYKLWNKVKSRPPKKVEYSDDDEDDDEYGLNKMFISLNNVFENPNEGMHLLLVITKQFIPLPQLHNGMVLHSSRQLLNGDLRSTNVELTFSPENQRQRSELAVSILYTSSKHKIVPWWHPDFNDIQLFYKK